MPNDQRIYFKELVSSSKKYLEFGCGGTTIYASNYCDTVYCVESDKEWHDVVRKHVNPKCNINYLYVDIETLPRSWGHPGPSCSDTKKKNYCGGSL